MYYIYLSSMQVSIPSKTMETKISNKNKTINLLDTGEVNVLRKPGLTQVAFEFMLPNSKYPFDQSLMGYQSAPAYLDQLETLKTGMQPFPFIVVRMKDSGSMINITNMMVTLEEYTIKEDADEGYDMYADVKLKKWVDWGAKEIEVKTDENGNTTGTVTSPRSSIGHDIPKNVFVSTQKPQTLQTILRQQFGKMDSTNILFRCAKVNKILIPAVLKARQQVNIDMQRMKDAGGLVIH